MESGIIIGIAAVVAVVLAFVIVAAVRPDAVGPRSKRFQSWNG